MSSYIYAPTFGVILRYRDTLVVLRYRSMTPKVGAYIYSKSNTMSSYIYAPTFGVILRYRDTLVVLRHRSMTPTVGAYI